MDVKYMQWMQGNFSMVYKFSHITRGENETIHEFHGRFLNSLHKIQPSFQPRNILVDYAFVFDSEFRSLFSSENPTNLGQAFCAALKVYEFLAAEIEHNDRNLAPYQVSSDEENEDDSCLDDHPLVVAPLESYAEFHEYEAEELSLQVSLLVPFNDDDKIQKEEQQIRCTKLNQQKLYLFTSQKWFKNSSMRYLCSRGSNFWSNKKMIFLKICP
jgi:hypothetical protein